MWILLLADNEIICVETEMWIPYVFFLPESGKLQARIFPMLYDFPRRSHPPDIATVCVRDFREVWRGGGAGVHDDRQRLARGRPLCFVQQCFDVQRDWPAAWDRM